MNMKLSDICTHISPVNRVHAIVDAFRVDSAFNFDSILDCPDMSDVDKSVIAATVDQLCSMNKITPPDWVFDRRTYLDKPVFAMNATGNLRVVLLNESPEWFRSRNLFVSENFLGRV